MSLAHSDTRQRLAFIDNVFMPVIAVFHVSSGRTARSILVAGTTA